MALSGVVGGRADDSLQPVNSSSTGSKSGSRLCMMGVIHKIIGAETFAKYRLRRISALRAARFLTYRYDRSVLVVLLRLEEPPLPAFLQRSQIKFLAILPYTVQGYLKQTAPMPGQSGIAYFFSTPKCR